MSCHEREALTLRIKMALLHEALLHADNLTHRSIFQILGGQARLSRSLDVLFKYASGFAAPRARLGPSPPFLRHSMEEEWGRGTEEPS